MLFDTLCGITERHFPQWRQMLEEARIFRMERRQSSVVSEPLGKWELDQRLVENYRLPFDCVAIEEAAVRDAKGEMCIVLRRDGDPEDRRFEFLICSSRSDSDHIAHGETTAFPSGELSSESVVGNPENVELFKVGKRVAEKVEYSNQRDIRVGASAVGRYDRMDDLVRARDMVGLKLMAEEAEQHIADLAYESMSLNLNIGLLSVLVINEPSQFIVEERPPKERESTPKQLARSQWRPHYIVLNPTEIRRRFLGPKPEEPGSLRASHERRGHFRKLTSEKFKNKRGQVLWIDACWVGPREATVGKNRYAVMLDL